jgi:curved DNA-binding protein CbpA
MELRLLPYLPERDVYRLLGIPPNADRAAIVAACRRLSRTFHPDRNGSPRANDEMRVVNAVRSVLTDPTARAEYDRARLRFLSARPRVAVAPSLRPAVPRIERRQRPIELGRAVRAAIAGLLAGLSALAPPRCPSCDALVEPEYRYCGACGTRLSADAAQPGA